MLLKNFVPRSDISQMCQEEMPELPQSGWYYVLGVQQECVLGGTPAVLRGSPCSDVRN